MAALKGGRSSYRAISRDLGVSFGAVANVAQAEGLSRRRPVPSDPAEAEAVRQRVSAERAAFVEAAREVAFRRSLEQFLAANIRPLPMPPAEKAPRRPVGASVREPLLVLTDWHFEEIVRPSGVLGLNEYNASVAGQRLWRIVRAVRDWKQDFEAGGRFRAPGLTVALLGDLVTGTLHGLERHSSAPNIVRAALACGDLLALVLADLLTEFRAVQVVGVVGNHGRLPDDRRVPTKDPTRSWDFVAYETARRRLAAARGIRWEFPDAYGLLFEVAGHTCYAAHGNFIPNNLGVVGYGVRRFTANLAANLSATGRPLKYAFLGHWHQANSSEFAGVEAFICPALIGTQEYSFLSGGAISRPAQELFIFDRQLGIVTRERFYGDGSGPQGAYPVAL